MSKRICQLNFIQEYILKKYPDLDFIIKSDNLYSDLFLHYIVIQNPKNPNSTIEDTCKLQNFRNEFEVIGLPKYEFEDWEEISKRYDENELNEFKKHGKYLICKIEFRMPILNKTFIVKFIESEILNPMHFYKFEAGFRPLGNMSWHEIIMFHQFGYIKPKVFECE